MIISELKIYNFRQFKSVNGVPGLEITFHKGLNALIGEKDSGKSAVIDALKLILLTQSNEYIRPSDEDFYKPVEGEACSELKIDCTIAEFTQNEAKNFIEYLSFTKTGDKVEYTLELHYRAWKEGHKIYQELRVGDIDDGISIDGKAREFLKAVYLKPESHKYFSITPFSKTKRNTQFSIFFRMRIDALRIILQMIQMGNVFSRQSATI